MKNVITICMLLVVALSFGQNLIIKKTGADVVPPKSISSKHVAK